MFSRVPNPDGPPDTTVTSSIEDDSFAADSDWWLNAIEVDSFDSPLPFDSSEGGLWNGRFVPPPPRPPFLDESVATDGLTTCDLCTWAWHDRNAFSLDGSIGGKDIVKLYYFINKISFYKIIHILICLIK